MQNFAINGGTLNGDPEVWMPDSLASLAIQAAGDGMRGALLEGSSTVELAADCDLLVWVLLEGQASVELAAAGEGLRWVMIEGQVPIELVASGDVGVVQALSATFVMDFRLSGDITVAQAVKLEGGSALRLAANGSAGKAKTSLLSGVAPLVFAAGGRGALVIDSPPGTAAIKLLAQGAARLGAKVPLEGAAAILLYARGSAAQWRYVFAEGTAAIELRAASLQAGIPPIPAEYVEAPASRIIIVPRDARECRVPRENRSI